MSLHVYKMTILTCNPLPNLSLNGITLTPAKPLTEDWPWTDLCWLKQFPLPFTKGFHCVKAKVIPFGLSSTVYLAQHSKVACEVYVSNCIGRRRKKQLFVTKNLVRTIFVPWFNLIIKLYYNKIKSINQYNTINKTVFNIDNFIKCLLSSKSAY